MSRGDVIDVERQGGQIPLLEVDSVLPEDIKVLTGLNGRRVSGSDAAIHESILVPHLPELVTFLTDSNNGSVEQMELRTEEERSQARIFLAKVGIDSLDPEGTEPHLIGQIDFVCRELWDRTEHRKGRPLPEDRIDGKAYLGFDIAQSALLTMEVEYPHPASGTVPNYTLMRARGMNGDQGRREGAVLEVDFDKVIRGNQTAVIALSALASVLKRIQDEDVTDLSTPGTKK